MKNTTVLIDRRTCNINNVSPDLFKDNLEVALSKYNAKVIINEISRVAGDFTRAAAISNISFESSSEKPEKTDELILKIAHQVFSDLKKTKSIN